MQTGGDSFVAGKPWVWTETRLRRLSDATLHDLGRTARASRRSPGRMRTAISSHAPDVSAELLSTNCGGGRRWANSRRRSVQRSHRADREAILRVARDSYE